MNPIQPTTPSSSSAVSPVAPASGRSTRSFSEALAESAPALVRSAGHAENAIPGAPIMAVATRTGGVAAGPIGGAAAGPLGGVTGAPQGPTSMRPGLGGALGAPMLGTPMLGAGMAGAPGGGTETANLDSALEQSQEMNLYYLQVQQQVDAQNRMFTTLSNVMNSEHETAKTAIGNIR